MLNTKIFDGLIENGDKVLGGVSGGADSMCLLCLLKEHQKEVDFDLVALHVNHGLRDKEAERDQKFVQRFCEKNDIRCVVKQVDVKAYVKDNKKTTEEAARELRYSAFDEVMKKNKLNKLMVAHNKNDQVETLLMHLLRGSSIKGMVGMSKVQSNIVRPLIEVSREEIEEFNKAHEIVNIEDSTNSDSSYKRNYVRHELIPAIKKAYPGFENAILGFSKLCASDNNFIEKCLPLDLLQIEKEEVKLKEEVKNLDIALASRLVLKATEELKVFADVEEKHVKKVIELFSKRSGASVSLVHNLVAHRDYDGVTIEIENSKNAEINEKFSVKKTYFANFGHILVEKFAKTDNFQQNELVHFIDKDKLPKDAIWRSFKAGDMFKPVNAGSKKLSDYLSQKKAPKRNRQRIPILASGNCIYIVAGLGVSDLVKIDNNTENVYKITYIVD